MRRLAPFFVWLPLLLFNLWAYPAATASTGEVATFHVESVYSEAFPQLLTYLDLRDSSGQPLTALRPEQLSATLGTNPLKVVDLKPFDETGEGISYIFLIDVSTSIRAGQLSDMKEALLTWVGNMTVKDRATLVTFGEKVNVLQDFTADTSALKAKVQGIHAQDQGTAFHQGIMRALELGQRKDADLPNRRVIITLSDGHDTVEGGITKEEVLKAMQISSIPIYAIGFYNAPLTDEKQAYLSVLGEFARSSGGEYYQPRKVSLQEAYADVYREIHQRLVARLDCGTCGGDGNVYRLQVQVKDGAKVLSDGLDVRVPNVTGASQEKGHDSGQQPVPGGEPSGKQSSDLPATGTGANSFFPLETAWKNPVTITVLVVLLVVGVAGIIFIVRKGSQVQAIRREIHVGKSELAGVGSSQAVQKSSTSQTDSGLSELQDRADAGKTNSPGASGETPIPQSFFRTSLHLRFTVIGSKRVNGQVYEAVLREGEQLYLGSKHEKGTLAILGDPDLAPHHCLLTCEAGQVYLTKLEHMHVRYRTIVNGIPIVGRQKLQSDDKLVIGRTELRLTIS
ncbi:VWA domain-containing protein [Brevibacillus dissolubilis]|uniref:VWA domain-containing protein n=1 Tax=Brevibacillus dissolubilis TaxID=1844116 RepID=UPI0011172831|nr:VWA domain-containing protein [Brevibacillus dissolubilis]